ncbi:MAG: S9 family peptidase [Planctomycetota bacterium]|jgi:dipeptidyl aminopeptidase/acylaminoacyl peptidase
MNTFDPQELIRRVRPNVCLISMLLLMIFTFLSQGAFCQSKRINVSDIAKMVELSDPQISPDAKRIIVVVSRRNFEENRFENELVLVDITTGAKRVLTYDRQYVWHPRWSPSGDRLAFLESDKKEKSQVFVMPMNGGDAKRITNAPRGVSFFAWRPDGKELAFVTEDEPEEKTDKEKHNKSFEVGDNVYLAKESPMPAHIWLVSAEGDTAKRLTSGLECVSKEPIDWSPDGNSVVYISQPRPHTGELIHELKNLDVTTGAWHTIVPAPAFLDYPKFSPDGSYLAYHRPVGPEPWFNPNAVFILPTSGGESVIATPDIDRDISGYWLPDSKSILAVGFNHTRVSVWLQPLGASPRKLDLGTVDPLSRISVASEGQLAFIGVEPKRPPELYYMPSTDFSPKRLTDFNAELASRQIGSVESISWEGPDGFEENGVLFYPPDFDKNKKYPLVLLIHGGPMDTSTLGFSCWLHVMAARDWVVFSPNYRGSNNMGRKFQRAIINDAGDGPGRDVMAGIKAVKARGFVDENRVAVSGWSYGGFMTTWLIAHYQGWKAAVAGAAVTDWFDSYNLTNSNVWNAYGLGGSPWLNNNAQRYWKQSPISYAPNIRTPTLILSNTDDPLVTVTQSYKLYHALKDNGVPVQFIAYPIPGHGPGDPVHEQDVFQRWVDWIERHFEESHTSGK